MSAVGMVVFGAARNSVRYYDNDGPHELGLPVPTRPEGLLGCLNSIGIIRLAGRGGLLGSMGAGCGGLLVGVGAGFDCACEVGCGVGPGDRISFKRVIGLPCPKFRRRTRRVRSGFEVKAWTNTMQSSRRGSATNGYRMRGPIRSSAMKVTLATTAAINVGGAMSSKSLKVRRATMKVIPAPTAAVASMAI
jgi:hypothetical protein